MAEAYSVELRRRVVLRTSAVARYQEVADKFEVGVASVNRWVNLKKRLGSLVPKPKAGGARSTITSAEVEAALAVRPDSTALELTAEINRGRTRSKRIHVSSTNVKKTSMATGESAVGRRIQADPLPEQGPTHPANS